MFSFLWQAENIQDSLLSYDLPEQKVEIQNTKSLTEIISLTK